MTKNVSTIILILAVTLIPSAVFAESTTSQNICIGVEYNRSIMLDDQPRKIIAQPLIYRNKPLTEVVADLNRLGPRNFSLGPRAAKMRFSGVLITDDQGVMVVKLKSLLPIFLHCEGDSLVFRTRP